jgi:hypothetical protein
MSPVLALSTENASKPNDNLSRSLGDVLSDRPYSIGLGFCHFAKPLPLQKNYNYSSMKLVHLLFGDIHCR